MEEFTTPDGDRLRINLAEVVGIYLPAPEANGIYPPAMLLLPGGAVALSRGMAVTIDERLKSGAP